MNSESKHGKSRQRGRRSSGRKREHLAVPQASDEALARLAIPLEQGHFVVFDIETTGGNPEKNGITEIFAIRFHAGEVKETFYSMVNPGIPIPPIVRRMTGINNQMVRNAPRIDGVMPDFVKFIGTDVLVSHNTIGDMKFIRHFAKQTTGIDLENFYCCTHLLVEKLAPETPDKSLKGLAQYFALASGELHRAEADAYVTLALFKVLLGRLRERSVRRIDEAVRLQGDLESGMRLGWGVALKVLDDVPPGPGVYYLYDQEKRPLFFSSAMHLDREVAKLRVAGQLPRQLLRLVLKSADLQVQRTPNVFAAMLEEAVASGKHPLTFPPGTWHQRQIQALFLTEDAAKESGKGRDAEASTLRLNIGPLEEGTKYAFGFVRDRRQASDFIDALAAQLGLKVGRYGLKLPLAYESALAALFSGSLMGQLQDVERRRRSVRLWFNSRARQELAQTAALMQKLSQLVLPARLMPLLDFAGVIIVQAGKGKWQVYKIAGSQPFGMVELEGDLATKLWQSGLSTQLQAEIQAKASQTAVKTLDLAAVSLINATLWWICNGKSEGRFIPASEMTKQPADE